jgi:hypothetical protein
VVKNAALRYEFEHVSPRDFSVLLMVDDEPLPASALTFPK